VRVGLRRAERCPDHLDAFGAEDLQSRRRTSRRGRGSGI
jgi:hypothetical protein